MSLFREKGLMGYLAVCILVFMGLMFVQISALYDWFDVVPSSPPTLWRF
jgi:hypothetical protein